MDAPIDISNVSLKSRKGKPLYEYSNRLYRLYKVYRQRDETKVSYYFKCYLNQCRGHLKVVLNHENRTVNIDPNEFSHICNPDRNEIMRKKGRAAILNLMMENDNHDYQTVVGRVLRQLTYDIGFAETMQFD